MFNKYISALLIGSKSLNTDFILLFWRIILASYMLFGHGSAKLFTFSQNMNVFPDPLGIGSPVSLTLAVFAEFFCSILLAIGLFSRFALINLAITMSVAGFIFHANDPFKIKELAFVYLLHFVVLFFIGPGKYSIDRILFKK